MDPPRLHAALSTDSHNGFIFQQPTPPQADSSLTLADLPAPARGAPPVGGDDPDTEHKYDPDAVPLHSPTAPSASQQRPAKKKRKRPLSEDNGSNGPYSEIDSILAQKRKPREKTACHPCRKRKVGCDRKQPCQTCIERRHPEVCVYEGPNDTPMYTNISPVVASADNVTIPKGYLDGLVSKVDRLESSVRELTENIRAVLANNGNGSRSMGRSTPLDLSVGALSETEEARIHREGIHTNDPYTGQQMHIGGNSVPALIMTLAKHQEALPGKTDSNDWKELLNRAAIPLLGLDNEDATYPFVDLWSNPEPPINRIRRLVEVLPSEQDCHAFFNAYVSIAQVIFPALAELPRFEDDLIQFHIRRAQETAEAGVTEQMIYGKSLSWIALLFAVMASGCHFSEHLDLKSRDLTCKVFVCCSFECLRLANFLSSPTLESIQAMMIFLSVLLNMYNAGVAWVMLGLNIRMAQSMGLHQRCLPTTPLFEQNERAKIYHTLVWQDCLISVMYDRSGCATGVDVPIHMPPDYDTPIWVFERCMYHLCAIGLQIIRERHTNRDVMTVLHKMVEHERSINSIGAFACDQIRDIHKCRTLKERIQHWMFSLHRSYIITEVCRPAISPGAPKTDLANRMRRTCIQNLTTIVHSWLNLFAISPTFKRSWPSMQRALASALLLGVLKETEADPNSRQLLADFLAALEDITAGVHESDIAPPLHRSIVWLRKLSTMPTSHSTRSSSANGLLRGGSVGLHGQGGPSLSSPSMSIPSLGSEDSPYAVIDRMMWPSGTP